MGSSNFRPAAVKLIAIMQSENGFFESKKRKKIKKSYPYQRNLCRGKKNVVKISKKGLPELATIYYLISNMCFDQVEEDSYYGSSFV